MKKGMKKDSGSGDRIRDRNELILDQCGNWDWLQSMSYNKPVSRASLRHEQSMGASLCTGIMTGR